MIPSQEIETRIAEMAEALRARLTAGGVESPLMIGIHTGGVWIAERLHRLLGLEEPLGTLDISFYRDDFTRSGINPSVHPSNLPFSVDDRHIILVDDVLYTGRTIRAALNELFDYGRPASACLVVLVNRNGRELPIEPQVEGMKMELERHEQVKLGGPEELTLTIQQAP